MNTDPNTGMPLNIVNQPPVGAKSGSPMDVANANIAANNAKMSSLIGVTSGGSRANRQRHHSLYGGAALVVQPLHVPYPGGSQLQNVNTQMTSVGAQNVANSQYDNDWKSATPMKQNGGKRNKRTKRRRSRSYKRSINRNRNRSRRYKSKK